MGTWGTQILDNDLSIDIKEDYQELMSVGIAVNDVCKKMYDQYLEELEDEEETNIFWLTLAFLQIDTEVQVNPIIKEKVLDIINSGQDLERWMDNPGFYAERKKPLEQLKQQLLQS